MHIRSEDGTSHVISDYVGFGTLTPGTHLHLYNGGANIAANLVIDCKGDGTSQSSSLVLLTLGGGNKIHGDAATKGWQIAGRGNTYSGTAQQNDLQFNSWDGTSWVTAMHLEMTTGNVGLGVTSFGTSATRTLAITNGTAPTTAPADLVQLWSADVNGVAGKAGLHMLAESGTSPLVVVGAIIKGTTGDPSQVHEGLMCINTYDNNLKMYCDGAWRTLATW